MSLQHAILGFLAEHPATGYQISLELDKTRSLMWSAKKTQVYRELKALESNGLIEMGGSTSEGRADRRVFTITPKGKVEVKKWLEHPPEVMLQEKRDEFTLRLFFGAQSQSEFIRAELQKFITEREMELQRLPNLKKYLLGQGKEASPVARLYYKFIIDRSKAENEALLQWAEECLDEMKNGTWVQDTPE